MSCDQLFLICGAETEGIPLRLHFFFVSARSDISFFFPSYHLVCGMTQPIVVQ